MIARSGGPFDIVLVSAEHWDDHPLSPVGVIARVLETVGYSVGIIERPVKDEDFKRLGAPGLFFGVTSGSIDSMLNNYTPLKRRREFDKHSSAQEMPDRAVISYCNSIRRNFKGARLVIGGIEASLRRFVHYDYWDNDIRRSVLFDSKADILVYGNGEKQVVEIANRSRDGNDLTGIEGTCIRSRTVPDGFKVLPSFKEVKEDPREFARMQTMLTNSSDLAQEQLEGSYLLQYRYPEYTTEDLDRIYSLPFSRKLHPDSNLGLAHFSVVTHRGCMGRCSFCAIALHQGDKIISRSEGNILAEIARMTRHPQWKGFVDDLGGPTANMYGMDCEERCERWCLTCGKLDRSHSRIISLMKKARVLPGVKKVFVRSGVRFDLAMESDEYIRELSEHHVSGTLKIAPEHLCDDVVSLMNKDNSRFMEFVKRFDDINKGTKQTLRYYLMIGHPGDTEKKVEEMARKARKLKNIEQFQLFTPIPMCDSTAMYWTGLNPKTMEPIVVVRDYATKKKMKRTMLEGIKSDRKTKR